MSTPKKKCFVVTPIGNADNPIRRHIDGIIDQAITPALSEKYEIDVAHRKYEIGSINDRVIQSVYEADLVVANLTTLNPNVMFELAIRYSFGKPAIVIAEEGTKLPFDITDENTIFYINDPAGAADLRDKLVKFEQNIDFSKEVYGPVCKSLGKVSIIKEVESGASVSNEKMFTYIVNRLDYIESSMKNIANTNDTSDIRIVFSYSFNKGVIISDLKNEIYSALGSLIKYIAILRITTAEMIVDIPPIISQAEVRLLIKNIKGVLMRNGAQNIKYDRYYEV